ncbi:mechanosensitive ion channel family protein [Maritimibacter sp. HL-12]|uniref:mechanosensitive ion channel family protein n=1 Tax=Maritimibacter sp. HL-12 TaxID=1162418 RepID=UPI000A0F1B29|nr:mechanosensitive ion channel family protein [Maritimibacter sp. HL-12]SMH40123.1 Small-conductance mechanosensitive channel [Maritimibacter sp. HL-12]
MNLLRYVLVSLLLVIAAPVQAQDGTITTEEGASSAVQAQSDAAIATRIRDIIHELEGYEDVTVAVKAGVVTLRGTTLDAGLVEELGRLTARVNGVVAVENRVTLSTSVADRLTPAKDRLLSRAQQGVAYLPLVAVALLAFVVVTWIGVILAQFRQPWDRLAPNAFIAELFRTFVRLAAVIAGVVVALDILGASALLSTILGAAGIVGLAIGFAVRDTVENFIASVLLSIRQPFRPNDAIEIGGDEGKVIRLTSRATILLSWDGNQIRIPNSTVFKSRIVNYSRNPERRFKIDFGVAYGTDLVVAKTLAEETVAGLPFVLKIPTTMAWTTTLNGSDIGMTVVGWIDQRETGLDAARSEAIRQLLIAFDKAGIEMPEPTYRLLTRASSEVPVPPMQAEPVTPQAKAAPPAGDAVQTAPAIAEQELEELIKEERHKTETKDLLAESAKQE